ncbi:hypothetical protein AAFF_G00275640 [Aldrovandia affinis]|uniref:Uncharacterized protein n=1 Tax=Aldrovandia affinis TaxID=143900 RepID=A0AAD7RAM7_9TELE|nr:hypothetical protein AAFF_G00275640 [Aldrovandia affinis]
MQTVGLIHTLEQCLNRMQTVGLIHTLEQCLNRMQTVGLIHTLEQCLNRMQTVGLIHTLEQCLNRMPQTLSSVLQTMPQGYKTACPRTTLSLSARAGAQTPGGTLGKSAVALHSSDSSGEGALDSTTSTVLAPKFIGIESYY